MMKKLKNMSFANCVDRLVIFILNKKNKLFSYRTVFVKIFVYLGILGGSIYILYTCVMSTNIYEKSLLIVFVFIIAFISAYIVSKTSLLKRQKLNLSDDLLIIENSSQESEILNSKKNSFFGDDLESKIRATISRLNISNDKTRLALLCIYIHKINSDYKENYNYYSNETFIKSMNEILKIKVFSLVHYGTVMNTLCMFYDDEAKVKIFKEINVNSRYYHMFLDIKEVFDNILIPDSNKFK